MVKKIKSSEIPKVTYRPPVVVVLGHIDHGKTTLLDYIRRTKITVKEVGGITQKIGAYQVEVTIGKRGEKRKITFIDTPGHEAFAKMRGRGAAVADIAVLVVAADDGVMPQTKESIAHARAAKIPIVVAINKIDLESANLKRVKGQLVKEGLILEDQGGDTPVVPISAKTGEGVPELLEMIGLVADLQEVKNEPQAVLEAVVIESSLSPQQGPVATIIVKRGTLRVGEEIHAEDVGGKVKALIDDQGRRVKEAVPGMPVAVLGFSKVPSVGAEVASGEKTLPTVKLEAEKPTVEQPRVQATDLNVVLRADNQGSLEAITSAIGGIKVEDKGVSILLSGVGQIVDSDIYLARTGGGVVLGFNVGIAPSAKMLAEDFGVGVQTFTIIYELLEAVEKLLHGAEALKKAEIKGEGEVIKTFVLLSGDVVLGVRVAAGKIRYRDRVKVLRGEEEVHQGRVRGLKRGPKEILEATEGQEVGVLIRPQIEFKVKDRIAVC